MLKLRTSPWRRDSTQMASNKLGAVQSAGHGFGPPAVQLDRLASSYLVERVVIGNPTSWRRTDSGTAALTAAS